MADISSVGLLGLELIEILRTDPGIRLELYWSPETRRWRGDLTTSGTALRCDRGFWIGLRERSSRDFLGTTRRPKGPGTRRPTAAAGVASGRGRLGRNDGLGC